MKKYMLKDLKRYLRKEKEENERHSLYRRKSPRVSKCTQKLCRTGSICHSLAMFEY